LPDAAPAASLATEEVVRFLRAHPRFLADNPDLYRDLVPPERIHGEVLADHMAAQLRAARGEASAMAARAEGVLAAGRAAAGLAQRVQEAVLLLIGADDVPDLVAAAFPACLAVDAAFVCAESPLSGTRPLHPGTVALLLGAGAVRFRRDAPPDPALHGEAARLAAHEAFVRIPGDGPPALLALAARDGATLDPLQGCGALAFLGRSLAAALGR
jgi:uncharacterized protein YigA (DUF484 family)